MGVADEQPNSDIESGEITENPHVVEEGLSHGQ